MFLDRALAEWADEAEHSNPHPLGVETTKNQSTTSNDELQLMESNAARITIEGWEHKLLFEYWAFAAIEEHASKKRRLLPKLLPKLNQIEIEDKIKLAIDTWKKAHPSDNRIVPDDATPGWFKATFVGSDSQAVSCLFLGQESSRGGQGPYISPLPLSTHPKYPI